MDKAPHYVLVAGEPSGDVLGAELIKALLSEEPHAQFSGIGGHNMIAAGLRPWFHIDDLSVNGFVAPLMKLPSLLWILWRLQNLCKLKRPSAFVGIDFNFFNLLLAGLVKRHRIPTVHYVSPTVWAWRQGRINTIRRRIDLMLTLYPFETDIYLKHGIPVRFVGHPRAQEIDIEGHQKRDQVARRARGLSDKDRVIALLPGSRRSEIASMMPAYLEAVILLGKTYPDLKFIVAAANDRGCQDISGYIEKQGLSSRVAIEVGDAIGVMAASDAVLVNSGTATLEAMLLRKPMVMAYRLGNLTYQLVSRLVVVEHFALPNILADKPIVEEFMQDQATGENLARALGKLLIDDDREALMRDYTEIHRGLIGDLQQNAARPIIQLAEGKLLK